MKHGRGYVYDLYYHIVWCVKYRHKILLNDIKEITLSEERNRELVTRLKTEYRTIYIQYNSGNKKDYSFLQGLFIFNVFFHFYYHLFNSKRYN